MMIKSYQHQTDALEISKHREYFALLLEMGTGKTKIAIDTISANFPDIQGALVLAPKGVYMNWLSELDKFLLSRYKIWMWRGGKNAEQKSSMKWILSNDSPIIVVMNIEALSTKSDKAYDFAEKFLHSRKCIMIVDESTTIKNHRSKRTEAVCQLGKYASMRRILTGMPVTKSPLDVFSQFQFLKPGLLGQSSFYSFRARYAVMEIKHFGPRAIKVVTGYRNEDDLQRRIAPHSFRVLKKDCLDLPPKIYVTRSVELTSEQRRLYDTLREEASVQLNQKDFVTATEAITQIIKLHQISCGHVVDENGVVHDIPNKRVEQMLEVCEEADGQAIIWSAYRADIPNITKALSERGNVVEYHGGINQRQREQALIDFEKGHARYFVGTPHTGGWGINLVSASLVIYYSNTYDLEKRAQSEDRAHRIGQTAEKVTYVDLVSEGTVDEKILKVLRKKINLASAVVGDGYREWLI